MPDSGLPPPPHAPRLASSDPSALTTAQLEREIMHLREYLQVQLEAMDKATEAARATIATAVDAAATASQTAVSELDTTVQRQMSAASMLSESRFVTHRTLLDSQAAQVALALSAADKAVQKAEGANEKRFDAVNEFRGQLSDQAKSFIGRDEFAAALKSLSDKVDDLKQYRDANQGLAGQVKALSDEVASLRDSRSAASGRQEGIALSAGALAGIIAAAVGVLSLVVVVVNVLIGNP